MNIFFLLIFSIMINPYLFSAQPAQLSIQGANKARSNSVIGKKRKEPSAESAVISAQPVKPLFENCSHMSVQAIKEALEQGADPNEYTGNRSLGSCKARGSSNEWTPLHYVAMNAHTWSIEELAQCAQLLMQAGALLSLRQRVLFASEEKSIKRIDTVPHVIKKERSSVQSALHVVQERLAKYDALRNALIQADEENRSNAFHEIFAGLAFVQMPDVLCALITEYSCEKSYQELEAEPYHEYRLVTSHEHN